jgi:hypothetical protein
MGFGGEVSHTVGLHWQDQSVGLCLLGGLAVGCIVVARMWIFGKVTGISGFVQNTFVFDKDYVKEHGYFDHRRIASFAFLLGLMVSYLDDIVTFNNLSYDL